MSTIENSGTLVKLKPGKYVLSGEHSDDSAFISLEESREAIILEGIGSRNPNFQDCGSAYLSLLDSKVIIVWQDQFEKL